jgi:hypothetical protein
MHTRSKHTEADVRNDWVSRTIAITASVQLRSDTVLWTAALLVEPP